MKRIFIVILFSGSLFALFGCSNDNSSNPTPPHKLVGDPKYDPDIIPFDSPIFDSYHSYDKARVRPYPDAVPGSLGAKVGYIENQWEIYFDKEYISDPSLWDTVTHKKSLKIWLSKYIPYPIKILYSDKVSDVWEIEVDAPSDKIPAIEATLKGLVNQGIIWTADHIEQILPQYDNEETRSLLDRSNIGDPIKVE